MTNNFLAPTDLAESIGVSEATMRNWHRLGVDHAEQASKLMGRANKRHSQKSFKPIEYAAASSSLTHIQRIVSFAQNHHLDISATLFLTAINFRSLSHHPVFIRELESWRAEIKNITNIENTHCNWFCNHVLQNIEGDFLGLLYQSLLSEGKKATSGSYYTPQSVARNMIGESCFGNSYVLDPACGTGQFLLEAANIVKEPTQLYGIDSDPIAVKICRINLIHKFLNHEFEPNVLCANTLIDFERQTLFEERKISVPNHFFDLVITNPPWGFHWSKQEKATMMKRFSQIVSGESFSLFLVQATKFVKKGGIISFLLPEAFLNIKVHADIRDYLVNTCSIKTIQHLGRIFSGVFTPVIRLDVLNENKKRTQSAESVFAIFQSQKDRNLLEKIEQKSSVKLKGQAQFALGIVTGNNAKHLLSVPTSKSEPIFRGKDVAPFFLKPATQHIIFQPEQYQQVAPECLFRAKEKLIYRFISKDLVFAYDSKQHLTLNSANILIPSIPDYPMQVLCAVLNSNVMRFVFRKKYNTLKVLRSDLELLPIPNLSCDEKSAILLLVRKFLKKPENGIMDGINRIIYEHYQLTQENIRLITDFISN